jgi:hypothetical protein
MNELHHSFGFRYGGLMNSASTVSSNLIRVFDH